ncbi:7TM diverse intracellular signaling domain-containing protein [Mucilaginibacter gracilis]|nr:7TM diverse intracellular signaling domain-containing protein [Mucilaginibacter gracilis]
MDDSVRQHIFSYHEIYEFVDKQGDLKIQDIIKPTVSLRFMPSVSFTPKTYDCEYTYWYRIRLKKSAVVSHENWVLEFYDQTIDHIDMYVELSPGQFKQYRLGAGLGFSNRAFHHKNITFLIDKSLPGDRVYYFAIRSEQPAAVMIVLKNLTWFIQYGLREYILLGALYGMILIFCLYNFLLFFALRQKQYIYYILYNLSIGIYEICSNGIAYQYFWPNSPRWNEIAYGIALYSAATFALFFTRSFLHLKTKAPLLDKLIIGTIVLRSIFFLACLLVDKHLFVYKVIEIVPILLALLSGVYVWRKGYHPARFFVAGYSFILIGFLIRLIKRVIVINLPFGPANFYSLSFCLLVEMLFVSFAISDNVRILKRKKEKAQKRIILELQHKHTLKDDLNRQLEIKVQDRTREVVEKSAIIEKKNQELMEQAQEISRMNALLQMDNAVLHTNIEEVTQARVMSKEVNFDEFSRIYPDNNACFKFLAHLKWENGFKCLKCGHETAFNGHTPYSKRCASCDYDESVTTNTIFHKTKIPINKAFYLVYLLYSTQGKISSYKLSEVLEIRQATCWSYSAKILKVMDERKKELRNAGEKGWSRLVLE